MIVRALHRRAAARGLLLAAVTPLVGALVLEAGPVGARRPGAGRASQLRLEGYLGALPPGQTTEAELTIQWGGASHPFQVTKARLLSGDRLAASVLDEVRPYRPNFILRGPAELLGRLDEAGPERRVTITGQYRSGGRDLYVGAVELEPK